MNPAPSPEPISSRAVGGRQVDAERAALAGSALERDSPPERQGQVLHDRETQARAAELARTRLVHAVEALEDPVLVARFDPDAGVLDFDESLGAGLGGLRLGFDPQPDATALGGVLQG